MSGAISAVSVAGATAAGAAGASTASIAGAALAANAGAIATIGGAAATGIGAIGQGNAAASSAKYNAQVARNNAEIATQNATFAGEEGEVNAGNQALKNRAAMGDLKANQGASGVDLNTGSSVNVRASAAEIGMLDSMQIRSRAAREAYGYQTQSTSDIGQSALDKKEATSDTEAGYIKASGGLLSSGTAAAEAGTFDPWLSQTSNDSLNSAENNFLSTARLSGGQVGP